MYIRDALNLSFGRATEYWHTSERKTEYSASQILLYFRVLMVLKS